MEYKELKDGAKIFLYNKELKKFLFHLRDNLPDIPHPNMWSLIGGGLEPDEDHEQAMIRETTEEINAMPANLKLLATLSVHFEKANKTINVYFYKGEIDQYVDELTLTEGQKLEYFTLDEALKLNLVPHIRAFIEENRSLLD